MTWTAWTLGVFRVSRAFERFHPGSDRNEILHAMRIEP
jgi:hypothetical protein